MQGYDIKPEHLILKRNHLLSTQVFTQFKAYASEDTCPWSCVTAVVEGRGGEERA